MLNNNFHNYFNLIFKDINHLKNLKIKTIDFQI